MRLRDLRKPSVEWYIQKLGAQHFIGLWTVHIRVRGKRTLRWCVSYRNEDKDHEETRVYRMPWQAFDEALSNLGLSE